MAISRREFIKAGAVGGIGAGLAMGGTAAATAAPRRQSLPWDIRDKVSGSHKDPEWVQCSYDTINRMVFLLGSTTFGDVFGQPLQSLMPELLPNIKKADRLGLIQNADALRRRAKNLASVAGDMNVANCFVMSDGSVTPDVLKALVGVRRQGVQLPLPVQPSADQIERQTSLDAFLTAGGNAITFKDLYSLTDEAAPWLRGPLQNLKFFGLFGWGANDKWCVKRGGQQGILDRCDDHPETSCYISDDPLTRGFCLAISDEKPPP